MKKSVSIGKKLRHLLLGISMASILLIGTITVFGLLSLRAATMQISGALGEAAASDSSNVLEQQIMSQLASLADSKTEHGDEIFYFIQALVKSLRDSAEDIAAHPQNYMPVYVPRADPSNESLVITQFVSAEGVNADLLRSELELMGNISRLLTPITEYSDIVESSYLGTETGLFLFADSISTKNPSFFDPRERPWYISAKNAGTLCWSDVYDDIDGRGLSITCAAPYFDLNGNIKGVAGIGFMIEVLNDIVLDINIGETGYAFVLNELGQMIISPTIKKDEEGRIIRENILESDNEQLRNAAEKMIAGEIGITRVILDGQDYFMAYDPFDVVPWSFAVLITVDEVLRPVYQSEQNIIKLKNEALRSIDSFIMIMMLVFVALVLAIVSVIGLISGRFSAALTNPIAVLQDGVGRIAEGNLDYVLGIQTKDEIEELGHCVNKMARDLKEHILDLQKITAEKERISAELNVATQIQASMLPCNFPAFPDRGEFDIFATMQPAKEVGGDFYDFFMLNENTLAVVIADVSGKGVPAALFMVIAKTLIKNNAKGCKNPMEVFNTVNKLLCESNEACMFVTAFIGFLDIPSGNFTYVNAGHNPPLVRFNNSDFVRLSVKPGRVLAIFEGASYQQDEINFKNGDMLYLYTDGVTEAFNKEKKLFTEERLLSSVNNHKNLPLKDFLISIKKDVDMFADGAEQADDMTMLILKITGE